MTITAGGIDLERVDYKGLAYYRHTAWDAVKHGVFTRHGGVSEAHWASLNVGGANGDDEQAVRVNHERMYEALDVNADDAVTVWLVHGVDTIVAHPPTEGQRWLAKADGIVTNQKDLPLVMRYADCVPLLAYDPVEEVIALGHAGWRGTVNGMGASLVQTMQEAYQCKPENIEVVIGPSISPENYQVGEEVVEAVHAYYGDASDLIMRDPEDGTAYFDLWSANKLDFERRGVRKTTVMGICTYENTQDFFSHRGEQGKTGRFGVVMSL
jgi:YfiH family protein